MRLILIGGGRRLAPAAWHARRLCAGDPYGRGQQLTRDRNFKDLGPSPEANLDHCCIIIEG